MRSLEYKDLGQAGKHFTKAARNLSYWGAQPHQCLGVFLLGQKVLLSKKLLKGELGAISERVIIVVGVV